MPISMSNMSFLSKVMWPEMLYTDDRQCHQKAMMTKWITAQLHIMSWPLGQISQKTYYIGLHWHASEYIGELKNMLVYVGIH